MPYEVTTLFDNEQVIMIKTFLSVFKISLILWFFNIRANMKLLLTFFFSLLFTIIYSQDTLQLMQYNLLNYGNYTSYCSTGNNNVNIKNGYLQTIIKYVRPDIFTVNELSKNESFHDILLNEVLNTDGVTHFERATSTNAADSYLVNMLYYNSEKLTLYSQDIVHAMVRDINVYTLYYNSDDLKETLDTIFITCFVAHLKAGSQSWNADKRGQMVSTAMTYITTHDLPENMLFMGDLNVYTNQEQAYKNLIYTYNGTQYFYDPIDTEGNWNNNYVYRKVHTQSTHTGGGCAAGGGLDDRFDFIMSSKSLLNGLRGMQLLTDTYTALGNDGEHFNKSINSQPINTSVPSDIVNALYGASDHLPIIAKINVDAALNKTDDISNIASIQFQNPCLNSLNLKIQLKKAQDINLKICNIYGQLIISSKIYSSHNTIYKNISMEAFPDGAYILRLTDENGKSNSQKFILKR